MFDIMHKYILIELSDLIHFCCDLSDTQIPKTNLGGGEMGCRFICCGKYPLMLRIQVSDPGPKSRLVS